jgi:hypothetical protein
VGRDILGRYLGRRAARGGMSHAGYGLAGFHSLLVWSSATIGDQAGSGSARKAKKKMDGPHCGVIELFIWNLMYGEKIDVFSSVLGSTGPSLR